jgi:uncharacterized membrane protein YbaN (DUF454 family)
MSLHTLPAHSDSILKTTKLMKRYLFAALGVFFVAFGAIGIWLPLIPTVGPLMLASFFFAKSFPALEERLIRNKLFAKFYPYLDGSSEMTSQQRVLTIATMWLSIGLSGFVLWYSGQANFLILTILVVLGLIGSVVIWRFGKRSSESDMTSSENEN